MRITEVRLFQTLRLTSLHVKNAVTTQVRQVRHFGSHDLGSRRTLWRTGQTSGHFGCVTSPLQTPCKPFVYLHSGKRHFYKRQCIHSFSTRNAYDDAFTTARDNPEKFWSEAAQNIVWFEPWHQTLDKTDIVLPKWWVPSCSGQFLNTLEKYK